MRTVLALTITGILAASVLAISIAQTQKKREVLLRPPRQQQQMMQWSVGTIAGFTSVALPRLATGVGQLEWRDVHPLVVKHLGDLPIPVFLYTKFQPGVAAAEAGSA